MSFLNLDANASYGLLEPVKQKLSQSLEQGLNPSSIHRAGQKARGVIEQARQSIRNLLGLSSGHRIIFTSGATESNNCALFSLLRQPQTASRLKRVVVSAIEHPSVLEPAYELARRGYELKIAAVNSQGLVDLEQLKGLLSADTALVSIMLANNEIGSTQPVKEISHLIREQSPEAIFHTDAVQALGKIKFNFSELGVGLMSISAHKIGALPGTGALIVQPGIELPAQLLGGPQENRGRAGTENVLGIHAFGLAAEIVAQELDSRIERFNQNRKELLEFIQAEISDSIVLGSDSACLPNTISLWIKGIRADDLVVALDLEQVLISSGSACGSGKPEPSHVLLALGLSPEHARQTIRLSWRAETSAEELLRAMGALKSCVTRMRSLT